VQEETENVKQWRRLQEMDPLAARFAAEVAQLFDVEAFIYICGKKKGKPKPKPKPYRH